MSKKVFGKFVFWLFLIVCLIVVPVYYHEAVHGAVCVASDGVASYGFNFLYAYTSCRGATISSPMSDFEYLNAVNELVGYNLLAVFFGLIVYPVYLKVFNSLEE